MKLLLIFLLGYNTAFAIPKIDRDSLLEIFAPYQQSCFILSDAQTGETFIHNREHCEKPMSPCSTFKIPNTLIGLETQVLKDASTQRRWDGKPKFFKSWEQDHTLKTAIQNSVVWYYQEVATAIGEKRMKEWLKKLNYGNQNISGGITEFWLGSSLKISPIEQLAFLKKIFGKDPPISKKSIVTLRDILIVDQKDNVTLRAKTGSERKNGEWILGWYIGEVEKNGKRYYFVTNIENTTQASGRTAQKITHAILKKSL